MPESQKQTDAIAAVEAAVVQNKISQAAADNIRIWLTRAEYSEFLPVLFDFIASARWAELDDLFWTVIPFGTAGRRGRMNPIGTNAINDRTIGESALGLADYVLAFLSARSSGGSVEAKGGRPRCAISYDTRHNSRHFAELCAEIMVAAGFEVLMFNDFRPTPELSFTVRDQKCACGIMISASHNPPSDNAIKAFWSTGGQLRSPHDAEVIKCVAGVREIKRVSFEEAVADGRVRFCEQEMDQRYQRAVLSQSQPGPRELRILYSPLHGVGLTSVLPILRADGFEHVEIYGPHATPDGDFPNVPGHVANPENAAVFDTLIEYAQRIGAELVLASDPDADRIGCAAPLGMKESSSQAWRTLSGNQIGVLLGEFLLRRLAASGKLTPEHYMIKTLVTGDMICRIAESFRVRAYGDVLTGFKWIGSLIDEIGPEKFVFGFEEAHGYLAGTYARDKDGAVAAMLLAELAAQCKAEGITLHEQLDRLFATYGCHLEKTVSHTLPGADGVAQMKQMMQRLRSSPPARLAGLKVAQVRDYLNGEIVDQNSSARRVMSVDVPPSDLLIFDLVESGNRAAVRPSGTEPKIKFYLFASQPPSVDGSEGESMRRLPDVKLRLAQRLDSLQADLIAAVS